tara:strand:- start:10 stop:540 length:531 start_codon:yes stop_codon:yes gene_type:complete
MMNLPNKKYNVIYADPPWNEVGGGKIKRGADKHYPLMKTNEIKKLPVANIADETCWLFLWVTNNYLKDGLDVMDAWGFEYITNLVWAKNTIGLGYYFRGQHELCLFGKKGQMKPNSRSESTLVNAKKTKHSKKPEEFYKKIEAVCSGNKIELFARNTRDGWDVWGNEVNSIGEDND